MIDSLRLLVSERGGAGVDWRLVAANGRAVAVSAGRFEHRADALASFAALCLTPDTLTVQYIHPSSPVAWTWQIADVTGTLVASADRTYDRYGTCITSCRRFVAVLRALGAPGASRLAAGAR